MLAVRHERGREHIIVLAQELKDRLQLRSQLVSFLPGNLSKDDTEDTVTKSNTATDRNVFNLADSLQ